MPWLNHWGIDKDIALQDINNLKNTITYKFKARMWDEKVLKGKRKLRCYKEVINPNLEDQKYLSTLTSSKKKINIAKIRTNSHELHRETRRWTIPKRPWEERICQLCESMSVEDESHFLLECSTYIHIRLQFSNLCYNSNLHDLLTCQNYGNLGTLLSQLFGHRNQILHKSK